MTIRVAALALALAAMAACGTKPGERPPMPVHVLAVLPLSTGADVHGGAVSRDDGAATVTAQIYRILAEQTAFRFAPDLTVVDALATAEVRTASGQLERAVALGKAVGADAVIVGQVTRFSPRVGTAYGASQGASVAFGLGLVAVGSGEEIWRGDFDDTQEALATNIFDFWMFWSAGPRWLTAGELAGLGVDSLWPLLTAAMTPE
ncbi:MAG: hypothetical protein ABI629_02525 [bacterium]